MALSQCVIYTRVSTTEQAEGGTSLADQLAICRAKAAQLGLAVAAHFEDAGSSGALYESREGLQNALAFIEGGLATTLLVAKVDRLARDRYAQSAVARRIERVGARLIYCNVDGGDTDEGELQIGILGDFAVYERRVFRRRSMAGRRRRAEEGIQVAVESPFGYIIPRKNDVLAGRYAAELFGRYLENESESPTVRRIFREIAGGASLMGLCKTMNREGVATKKGGVWRPAVIHRMIRNKAYKGDARYGKTRYSRDESRLERGFKSIKTYERVPDEEQTSIPCLALVDVATWEAANEVLDGNAARLGGNPTRKYLLSGIARCSKCGHILRASLCPTKQNGVTYRYPRYHCKKSSPGFTPDGVTCLKKSFQGKSLERRVVESLQKMADSAPLLRMMADAQRQLEPDAGGESARVRSQLETLEREERTIIKAQYLGVAAGSDTAIYEQDLAGVAARKRALSARLATLEIEIARENAAQDDWAEFETRFAQGIAVLGDFNQSLDERRAVLGALVESVVPYPNGEIDIKLRI